MKTTYRILCFTLIFVLPQSSYTQQKSGSLQGKVTTPDGNPVVHANVVIKELGRGDVTSGSGTFFIANIPPGTYSVAISGLGFEGVTREVEIREDESSSLEIHLVERPVAIPEVVVTATRSEKVLESVPIPTSVVGEEQIRSQAAVRLNDLLAEQQGMFLNFNQWGMGIQVEGLDPAYTLILVDGEPIIGRTAGTLELTRLSVGNIQRVEVVKGPSSSLYGSDALAAVVNLVTKQPALPFDVSLRSRYGKHNTLDFSGDIGMREGKFGTSVFVERNASDGYDLTPETESRTMPRSTSYTINPKVTYEFSDNTKLAVSGRYVTQNLSNVASVLVGASQMNFDDRSRLLDLSVAPSIVQRFSPGAKFEAKYYFARYKTETQLTSFVDGSIFDKSVFDQTFAKGEGQLDANLSTTLMSTLGGGYVHETVFADRISGDKRLASSFFVFGQQEWFPEESLDLIASFRYDSHTDYAARLTPKISVLYKLFDWVSVRASVGSGFKAPTFQQLYLDFTNPQVGYSVFGSVGVKEALQRLQQTGQVQSVLTDPSTLEKIRPENSVAYNASLDINPIPEISVKFSSFRNDLRDLIEAAPIAIKNNGQGIYTYFNINRVFTQGFSAEVVLKPLSFVDLSMSYQYLEAKDQKVLEDVREGRIFKIGSTGRARPVQEAEYGGLFQRSKHSGTLKMLFHDEQLGLSASLRGMLRTRYGFADNNGNNILDDDTEYAPGYVLWNLTLSKHVLEVLTLQAGVDNVFGVTNKDYAPFLSGRTIYGGVVLNF